MQYYIRRGVSVKGPFAIKSIKLKISAKKLKQSDEISLDENGPWDVLGTVYKDILSGSYSPSSSEQPVEAGNCSGCGKPVLEGATTCSDCGVSEHSEVVQSYAQELEEQREVEEYEDDEADPLEEPFYDAGLDFSVDQLDEYGNVTGGNVTSAGEAVALFGGALRDAKEALGNSKSIPSEVRDLLAKGEIVLYAGRPSELALKIRLCCLFAILFLIYVGQYSAVRGGDGDTGAVIAISVFWLFVFAVVWYLMRTGWKNTIYVVTDKRIIVRRGIFNRGIRLIPVRNIQTMSIDTGIIDRWLGFNKVAFVTSAALFGGTVFRHVDSAEVMQSVGEALAS